MLDTDPSINRTKSNDQPPMMQHLSNAINDWPPLFSIENDGSRGQYRYIALRLDMVSDEYYPFSELQQQLIKTDIISEIVGIDTTSENDLPRLMLEVDMERTDIDSTAIDRYDYYEPRHQAESPMHKVLYDDREFYFEETENGPLQLIQHTDENGEATMDPQEINEQNIADDIVAILKQNDVSEPIRF